MSSESIFNLVPREYSPPPKQPMFRSKHDPDATFSGSTFGCHGTTRLVGAGKLTKKTYSEFGPRPGESTNKMETSAKLRKTGEQAVSPSEPFRYQATNKPSIPSKDDRPVYGIRTNKNFITANAVEAILQAPKSTESTELNYLKKEDYGKVPAYLSHVNEEIRRENEMIQKYVKEQMGEVEEEPEQFEEMGEVERRELIDALKAKWDKVNAKYQKITHLVRLDTTGQVRRKEQLENELKHLENDIEKLQRAGPVLIR